MTRLKFTFVIGLGTILFMGSLSFGQTAASGPVFQPLLIFKGVINGGQAWSAPISDASGNLYGSTSEGGNGLCSYNQWTMGCGTIYKLSPPVSGAQWTETLLYQFQDTADGTYPVGSLIFDKAGNLYGTTDNGGASGVGTVFQLSPPASGSGGWSKTALYNFAGEADGSHPEAGLLIDKFGNLYGTATSGGSCPQNLGCGGVVFELKPPAVAGANWIYSVIYSFQGPPDGFEPQSTLVADGSGKLFGTTIYGGVSTECGYLQGCGTIFELRPPSSGVAWTETVLHAFGSQTADGIEPRSGLALGKSGSLYGVTQSGGAKGVGTVFQLAPSGSTWKESVLYSFTGNDGRTPFGNVAVANSGTIYGTTEFGGPQENGSIFQLAPPTAAGNPWAETSLISFTGFAYPLAGLTFGKGGWLYGATLGGAATELCATSSTGQQIQCGELFRILP